MTTRVHVATDAIRLNARQGKRLNVLTVDAPDGNRTSAMQAELVTADGDVVAVLKYRPSNHTMRVWLETSLEVVTSTEWPE